MSIEVKKLFLSNIVQKNHNNSNSFNFSYIHSSNKDSEKIKSRLGLVGNLNVISFYKKLKVQELSYGSNKQEKLLKDVSKSMNVVCQKTVKNMKNENQISTFQNSLNLKNLTFRGNSPSRNENNPKVKSANIKALRNASIKLSKTSQKSQNHTMNHPKLNLKLQSSLRSEKKKRKIPLDLNKSETFSNFLEPSQILQKIDIRRDGGSELESALKNNENSISIINFTQINKKDQSKNKNKLTKHYNSVKENFHRKFLFNFSRNSGEIRSSKSPNTSNISNSFVRKQSAEGNLCEKTFQDGKSKKFLFKNKKEIFRKLRAETKEDKFKVLKLELVKSSEKMRSVVEKLKKCQKDNEDIRKNFSKVEYLEKKKKKKYFDDLESNL